MKTVKKRINLFFTIYALLFGMLNVLSCDGPITLGSRLNIDSPAVTIEKPDFLENIRGALEITGTAEDNVEIAVLYITVERVTENGQTWKQELVSERGVWQSRSAGGSWTNTDSFGKSWLITKNSDKVTVDWSLTITMNGAPNGEYLITAGAENNVKTKGALQQRRVVIDNDPPVVKILSPVFYFDDFESNNVYSYDDDVEPEFDTYKLKDPAVLDRLHNKSIKIQYKIEDNFSVNTLYFQLADKFGNIYYNQNGEFVQNISWSGIIEIPGQEIIDPSDNHIIGASGEKIYLQVISSASDKAGNVRTRSHGWLVYWPDADKPWVTGVGGDKPSDFIVYPGSDVQGHAYDNDGVLSVSYKIFNNVTGVLIQEESFTNEPLAQGNPPAMFFSWKFKAPYDGDEYYIIIDCTDMYGTEGDTVKRFFFVQSSSAPDIKIEFPDAKNSLFGDKNGNFTISGFTGNGEPAGPEKLKMVWLNANDTTGSRFNYQSSEYKGWDKADTSGFTDNEGNIIWELALDAPKLDPSTQRYNRKFKENINLFTMLNIGSGAGKVPLSSQSFIFMAKGGNGLTAIKSYSFTGDVKKPELEIKKIKLESTLTNEYTAEELKNKSLPVLNVGDKITINGTWGDDSFDIWNDTSKMVKPQVLWNSTILPVTLNSDKTWKALYTLSSLEEAQIGSVHITAILGDFGNNITEKSISAKVETDVPVLMYITSENKDGYYNSGKSIIIDLEFNKPVTFNGIPPVLTLNSGTTAAVLKTSGSQLIHKFEYKVNPGENTNKNRLIVSKINYASCTGAGGNAVLNMSGRNLDKNKNIIIDTSSPSIKSVEALNGIENGTSYFKEFQDIYLLVKFNEDIIFTPANPNNTFLTLNSGGSGANPSISGTDSLIFTYIVGSGENTSQLTASGLANAGSGVITDLAGNNLTGLTGIPSGFNINNVKNKTIVIDTLRPASPTFTPSNISGTYTDKITFNINGESNARLEYSVKGTAGPWTYSPTGTVTLDSAGTYNISARQTDLAGNVSVSSAEQQVIIKINTPLLVSFGGTPGAYKAGQDIDIQVNFRGNVTVSGTPRLALGGDAASFASTPAYADYYSGSGSDKLIFRYNVKTSDSVNVLKIAGINLNGAALTEGAVNVSMEFAGSDLTKNLDYYSIIKIDTSLPAFIQTGSVLNGTTLTLNFNKHVYKGIGNITLEHQASPRLAPAVLSKAEYQRYGGASALGNYYTIGTNGTDRAGNPDLTEKYVLKYGIDTNNSALLTTLNANGAFKVSIPVASGAVSGSGTTALKIDLSDAYGYVLPVKGVNYTVTIPASLFQDSLSNFLASSSSLTVANPGVNAPVIRVEKKKESFKTSGTVLRPDISVNETPIVIPPSGYWVKNADIQISTSQPAGNWAKADQFHIYIPAQTVLNLTTYGISVNNPNDNKYIQLPSGASQHQGPLRANGSGGYLRSYSDWINGANRPEVSPYWLNPYVNTVGQGGGDGREGAIVISNAWVNLSSSGIQTSSNNNPSGNGWLRVTTGAGGAATEYDVSVTVGAYTSSAVTNLSAEQPLQAGVKIDCRTPGAVIKYGLTNKQETPFAGPFKMGDNPKPTVNMPAASTITASTFNLGDANNLNGYLYGIRAEASNGAYSETAYERASRSVIMFFKISDVGYWSNLVTQAGGASNLQLWIRGGDDTSGSNLTPGFPLSWNEKDLNGIRCLTNAGADTRYWVTWEVNTPAYFHFIAGRTANTMTDPEKGPLSWSWAKNSWALQYREYPLYPGGSLVFYHTTRVSSPATSTLEFYAPFSGSR